MGCCGERKNCFASDCAKVRQKGTKSLKSKKLAAVTKREVAGRLRMLATSLSLKSDKLGFCVVRRSSSTVRRFLSCRLPRSRRATLEIEADGCRRYLRGRRAGVWIAFDKHSIRGRIGCSRRLTWAELLPPSCQRRRIGSRNTAVLNPSSSASGATDGGLSQP